MTAQEALAQVRAEIEKRQCKAEHEKMQCQGISAISYNMHLAEENAYLFLLDFLDSIQVEEPEVDLGKEEFVGVAESPLKTFPRVNDFECGGSYRH